MGDVLEFPSQQSQGLAHLERKMRELLTAKGADEQLISFATEQLTQIYSSVSASEQQGLSVALPEGLTEEQQHTLKGEIENALQSLHGQNHRLLLELVAQLVLAKVQLFQQERAD